MCDERERERGRKGEKERKREREIEREVRKRGRECFLSKKVEVVFGLKYENVTIV